MLPFYVQCLLIGILGTAASVLLALRSLSIKARIANLIFHPSDYFRDDWYSPVGSIVAILILIVALPYAPKGTAPLMELALFFLAGYFGNDLIFKFASVANNRLNNAIDYKTTQADQATGNLNAPTPAAVPKPPLSTPPKE